MVSLWLSASGGWASGRRSRVRSRLGIAVAAGLGLAVLAPAAWAQPAEYSGAEIRARVVDAETQKPLEGVFVVARWDLSHLMSRGHTPLHAMEAVTDATGQFYFPPWGPKPRPTFSSLWGGDPRLFFFKPGYEPHDEGNRYAPDDSPVRVSKWHGQTIQMKPFRGTPAFWVQLLVQLQDLLNWGDITPTAPHHVNDYWKYYPRTVLAILDDRQSIPEAIRHRVRTLELWQVTEHELRAVAQRKGASP